MFHLGKDVQIHPAARIDVRHGFLGDRSIVREHVVIEGYHVEIGAEAFFNRYADLGGGSCFDPQAKLVVGDFFHVGLQAHVNYSYPVLIGHECGIGIGSRIYAHGAYSSIWEGFPVQWGGVTIGDRVWLPQALVLAGVTIGSDVVVAAGSLVNKDLPDGCLAAGVPAKILQANAYPQQLTSARKQMVFDGIFAQAQRIDGERHSYIRWNDGIFYVDTHTLFDLDNRKIEGRVTTFTEVLKNQLRRNGVRFRYLAKEGMYNPWEVS